MRFSFYTAKRYFFAKKSHNAINIISAISVAVITIVSAALIILLSVFNGLEGLIVSLYNSFDPDIKITIKEGKIFDPRQIPEDSIKKIAGVKHYCYAVEENALLKYQDKQYIATVKGVTNDFFQMSGVDSMLVEGDLTLEENNTPFAIAGYGIAYFLSLRVRDFIHPINIYSPKAGYEISLDLEGSLIKKLIYLSGIFSIQPEYDDKYILVPLSFARNLFNTKNEVSAIEIGLLPNVNVKKVQQKIKEIVGEKYEVKNRYQLHEVLYKIMKSEKLAVFLIITFILIIAIFNVIGSLTMLIIDKKKDINTLRALGATNPLIRRIFLFEGLLISVIGVILGLIIGTFICFLQDKFHLVKLHGSGSFIIDAYPVVLQPMDFIYVFLTVFLIGFLASYLPVRRISKRYLYQQ